MVAWKKKKSRSEGEISSVKFLSHVWHFAIPWTAACHRQLSELTQTHVHRVGDAIQPSHPVSIPFSSCLQSFPASGSFPMSQFPSGGQSIGVLVSQSVLPMNSGLISFRIDWFDLLEVQRTLKSLLQHHSSKASIPQRQAFFIVQLSYPYMTTGKPKFWLDRPYSAR